MTREPDDRPDSIRAGLEAGRVHPPSPLVTQPDALKSEGPLVWSPGRGVDVWALFQACVAGDLGIVRSLLDRDPSLARCQHAYRTPLYFAVRENHLDIVALLFERGADPLGLAVDDSLVEIARDRGHRELEDFLQKTLADRFGAGSAGESVASAIRERDLNRVRELLDADPDRAHAGDGRSNQPIHWAVMTRQLDLIDFLLARGASIDARRSDGARPIHLTNGDYHYRGWRDVPATATTTPDEVYRHLVERGAEVDLGMAAAKGDGERVRALVEEDPSRVNRVAEYGSYYLGCGAPLKNAAAAGQLEIARYLLEHGADPNLPEEGIAPQGHALYSAVAEGHFEIARLLLEHGANPNAAVESSADVLSRAIGLGDKAMVDLLCAHGAARPIHLLAYYDDLQTAAAVFAANPTLADDPEALENTASEAFVRLLLRHQPDLPKKVTVAKDPATTALLFRHGMDPSRRDWLGGTPLHDFARKGRLEDAALFLEQGADLDARDEVLRSTPLGCAAKFGKIRMVEFLLRRGARIRLPDDPPWATPLAWAERRGHVGIASLLRHHAQWGVLPRSFGMDHYESLAADWITAYDSGDTEALERLAAHFQIDRVPTPAEARQDLNRRIPRLKESGTLAAQEARTLVAALHGFKEWSDLGRHVSDLDRNHQRVSVWQAVDQALIDGDADTLERLLAGGGEQLPKRPKGAYPACVPVLDPAISARELIVREHQLDSWEEFQAFQADRNRPSTALANFEDAVDAVVSGAAVALRRLLDLHPDLVHARSRRAHQATLLHYVGANGVEGFRQRTPANAVEIVVMLLEAGSEVDAPARMYGGSTALGLVATSVHPWFAGVQLDLIRTLLDHGAAIDHPQGSGHGLSVTLGCLANGRREAAEFLAARGAAVDFEAAAGLGRLDIVRESFEADGGHRPGVSEDQFQSGFQWACQYGRTEVVGFLLEHGADATSVHRGRTGLHWAAYGGHLEIVRLLLERGASVDVEDGTWKTTPLGWAVYGWFQPPGGVCLELYPAVVSELVRRGARVRPEWIVDPRVRSNRAMAAALSIGERTGTGLQRG